MIYILNILFFLFISFYIIQANNINNNSYKNIAVCIGGQASRWQPENFINNFLNQNQNFNYYFFFNLQHETSEGLEKYYKELIKKKISDKENKLIQKPWVNLNDDDFNYNYNWVNLDKTNRYKLDDEIKNNTSKFQAVYNTLSDFKFSPSYMYIMNKTEAYDYVNRLYSSSINNNNITIATLKYHKLKSYSQILNLININKKKPNLEVFYYYKSKKVQYTILNMYLYQILCSRQIVKYESNNNIKFDYIVQAREDTYFTKKINLNYLTNILDKSNKLRNNNSDISTNSFNFYNLTNNSLNYYIKRGVKKTFSPKYCDVLFKRCLSWNGINMRFNIYSRDVGLSLLGNRLSFYSFLASNKLNIANPEAFEAFQANTLGFYTCGMSVEDIPVSSTRIFGIRESTENELKLLQYNNQELIKDKFKFRNLLCIIDFEAYFCIPKVAMEDIRNRSCTAIRDHLPKISSSYASINTKEKFQDYPLHSFLYSYNFDEIPQKTLFLTNGRLFEFNNFNYDPYPLYPVLNRTIIKNFFNIQLFLNNKTNIYDALPNHLLVKNNKNQIYKKILYYNYNNLINNNVTNNNLTPINNLSLSNYFLANYPYQLNDFELINNKMMTFRRNSSIIDVKNQTFNDQIISYYFIRDFP